MGDGFEMRFRLYHDSCGDYVEVTEDADGLGLIELRARDEDDKIQARITLTDTQVTNLVDALNRLQAFRSTPSESVARDE